MIGDTGDRGTNQMTPRENDDSNPDDGIFCKITVLFSLKKKNLYY